MPCPPRPTSAINSYEPAHPIGDASSARWIRSIQSSMWTSRPNSRSRAGSISRLEILLSAMPIDIVLLPDLLGNQLSHTVADSLLHLVHSVGAHPIRLGKHPNFIALQQTIEDLHALGVVRCADGPHGKPAMMIDPLSFPNRLQLGPAVG